MDLHELVESLHNTPACPEPHKVSEFFHLTWDYWFNASRVSIYAQQFADPYGDDEVSEAAARVIAESARVKMALIRAVICYAFPKPLRLRYTQRAYQQYQRLRDAAEKLGRLRDPHWGVILPCQL